MWQRGDDEEAAVNKTRCRRDGYEGTERLPLARSDEFVGIPSHSCLGHAERLRAARRKAARRIRTVRRWCQLRGLRPPYGDPDLPGSLSRCVRCGAETVTDRGELVRRYGWRPAEGQEVCGKGADTAHAYVCGDCNGLKPPSLRGRHLNGAVNPSDVA